MAIPAPSINALTPNSGPHAGGTSVVLTGIFFTNVTGVLFGSLAASSFTINSSTQITAVSPAQSSGNVSVAVVAGSGGQHFGAINFTYI